MLSLFNRACFECSKIVTQLYTTSFSLGIRAFSKGYQKPIYNIYGFVRFADEIVDTFHDYDKRTLLSEFKNETILALERRISLNPIIHSFQETVVNYNIPHKLIFAFLDSMEMDLYDLEYDQELLKKYIYGSAEVVGLMCLKVFCDGNEDKFEDLRPYAVSLGSAFQKINFLRDIRDDYMDKGRVYFPDINVKSLTAADKIKIEKNIQKEFDHALIGIKMLPKGVKFGVFLAYKYYIALFNKIKVAPPSKILSKRVRINDGKKMILFATSSIQSKLNML